MDQLIRETQPPAGTLRSPVPQYWNPDTEKYERVLGVHGAPRAMLYGPNGQPISTSNRLPVDVGAQVATESTLAEAVSRLNAILTRLEGTLDVDVGGQIHADVDLGDVTVQIGEVQQGKRGQNAEPWEVTLSGSAVILAFETNVEILPSETYRVSSIKLPYNKTRLMLRDRSSAGNLVNNVSVRVGFWDPNLSAGFVFASLIEAIPGDGIRYTAYEFESFGAVCAIDITNSGETTVTIDKLLVLGVDA